MDTFNVSFPGLGIHDITINRVAFSLFGIEVYWYGLLIATAVIAGLLMAYRAAPKFGVKPDTVLDTMIALVPMMIIFARLYYVVFSWDEFKDNPVNILNLRTGGLAYYGGVIGGILAMLLISRIRHVKISRLMDLMVVYVPLGQGIGRWGNFFNQEAFGSNTTLPWGMISNGTSEYLSRTGTGDPLLPVHPTFLYEFIANMIIFAILIYVRKRSSRPFVTTLTYLLSYGLVRFFVESIRTDSLYVGNTSIRVSMILSAVIFGASLIALLIIKSRPVRPDHAADTPESLQPDDTNESGGE
ncbi:MAG: prolipoprotein diacylglyceryl transferase [Saccharofermentanales bacterium]